MVSRRSLIRAAIFVPERHFDEMLGGPMPHRQSKGHRNVDSAANSAKCLAFHPARFCILRNDWWANTPTKSRGSIPAPVQLIDIRAHWRRASTLQSASAILRTRTLSTAARGVFRQNSLRARVTSNCTARRRVLTEMLVERFGDCAKSTAQ